MNIYIYKYITLSKKGRSLSYLRLEVGLQHLQGPGVEDIKTYVVFLSSVLYRHLRSVHSGSTPVSFWYGRNRVTILSSQF